MAETMGMILLIAGIWVSAFNPRKDDHDDRR